CDSTCRYETVMRLTYLDVRTTVAPSFCLHTKNAFGSALASEVAIQLDKSIAAATDGGENNMLLDFVGIDDLTGKTAPSISLGLVASKLDPRYESKWAPKGLDAWFLARPEMIDSAGAPVELFK